MGSRFIFQLGFIVNLSKTTLIVIFLAIVFRIPILIEFFMLTF